MEGKNKRQEVLNEIGICKTFMMVFVNQTAVMFPVRPYR